MSARAETRKRNMGKEEIAEMSKNKTDGENANVEPFPILTENICHRKILDLYRGSLEPIFQIFEARVKMGLSEKFLRKKHTEIPHQCF